MTERNIFLIGPMGAGKSTVGYQLAQYLKMEFYDSDKEIEKRTGVNISWVFDIEGENAFRNREKIVIDDLTKKNGIILSTGGGSILSLSSRNILTSRGIVIYLKTTVKQQLLRTRFSTKRPLLNKSNELNKCFLENLAKKRNPLYKSIADIVVDTSNMNIKSIIFNILENLKNN